MSDSDLIGTLNELIETCEDAEAGFRTAADDVRSSDLRALFMALAAERGRFAAGLRGEVRRLGGEPERDGTVAGSLHRGWMNLKTALTGGSDDAVAAAAESGEDTAKEAYERALARPLPESIRALVERQFLRVIAAHDRVRLLKRAA